MCDQHAVGIIQFPHGDIDHETAKDRESWRTLAEGCFLQWKDTA